ncbi:MAG TPA: alpha-mannosidase, partial [Opitutus sp.]|nr:alpha-mannosidase [Opitutus sp.]
MLPRTFLTQLTPMRIAEALRRIEAQIWRPLPDACAVTQTESFREHRTLENLKGADFSPIAEPRFFWGPKYSQRWFRVTLPPASNADKRYLLWQDQAEATAYIDGVPYSGLDLAHRFCPLPDTTTELHIEAVCIRTGIWLDGTAPALDEEG